LSLFVTFEGIEGCGKTTQINHLASFLRGISRSFLVTREPGGTEIGEQIRQILLTSDSVGMEPMAELFLYAAARVQHLSQAISPALREGKIVLCDRFADATVAYQGFGRRLDLVWVEEMNARAMGNVKPDLTFLLDLPVEEGLRRAWKRMENRTAQEDRFEKESLEFHQRVREGYLILARRDPQRIMILDGMRDEQTLHQEIVSHLTPAL